MRAWIDVLTHLWQSIERDSGGDSQAAQILRLELHLLRSTALRLSMRGALDRAQELRVQALVDDMLALTADAPKSSDWQARVQDRTFDEIMALVQDRLPVRQTA